jgi:hypothetical protein
MATEVVETDGASAYRKLCDGYTRQVRYVNQLEVSCPRGSYFLCIVAIFSLCYAYLAVICLFSITLVLLLTIKCADV